MLNDAERRNGDVSAGVAPVRLAARPQRPSPFGNDADGDRAEDESGCDCNRQLGEAHSRH
jgi:hypothetical protein